MKTDSGTTVSVWMSTADMPRPPRLARDLKVDVCVVGAGIAGLTTAYLLAREGRKVAVLEDGPLAGGETSRTTAHLTLPDEGFEALEHLHGEQGARLAVQSHLSAVDRIEAIARDEGIDCDFERLDGFLFVPPGEPVGDLDKELDAARRLGFGGIEKVERAPVADFDTGAALRYSRQGQFHPLKYLAGLVRALERDGALVFSGTRAEKFEGGAHARVVTREGHTVSCAALVVATNSPVNDRLVIHTKQHPYRTYVVGLRVPAGRVARALYWDYADPYHYVRLQSAGPAEEVLIVGGEDHHTGQADDAEARWDRLEQWARERWPMAKDVAFRWSGQVMEPVDGLAFIGKNPLDEDNVFIATGDSGNGMTHGTIAGLLLTDLIQGRANPWATLYDPSRKTLRATRDWVVEAAQSTAPYAEWLTPGEVSKVDEIPAGEGAVLRRGLSKVAAYRDPSGRVVERSAVCRHLGCLVEWNSGEKTWDCPCHGSRYTAEGRVVNGPATTDLPPAES
ncbi:MAG TPA: FAD-dependent oxidoreductase [Vicinamibacteria bacterium]|nr:FAD-dependent oxidoreductase [Vicinamibacteria bacterium]